MRPPVLRFLLFLIAVLPAAAADDLWQPVRDLARGSDLRVYRTGVKDPLIAKFDRAGEDSLIVTTKKGQLSVLKDEILRLDCRRPGGRLLKNTQAERNINRKGAEVSRNTVPGGTTSVKTGLELPVKSSFYTVYARPEK